VPTDVTLHGVTSTDWATLFFFVSATCGAVFFSVLFGGRQR
jgi:hypothetical protein